MNKIHWFACHLCMLLALSLMALPRIGLAQIAPPLTTLHSFSGGGDGSFPDYGSLLQAKDGNFYGTTSSGGAYGVALGGFGTIFKITPSGVLTTIYSFSGVDGSFPTGTLIQGTDGNLYGTTVAGGATYGIGGGGIGTVFKITTSGTLTTLHSFNYTDGEYPYAGLVQGSDGSLYGTTLYGGTNASIGTYQYGTVFKITTSGNFTSLYSFPGGTGGAYPRAGLIQGADGNLYGTTAGGGYGDSFSGHGTVFKITTSGTLTTLYSFSGSPFDGFSPNALIQGTDGDLYGTTVFGGATGFDLGTVFKITTSGALTTLYNFEGSDDGATPYAGLIQGSDGALYGTTDGNNNVSTIFKITTSGVLTTLHIFDVTDGNNPSAGLIQGSDGNLYGTTYESGAFGHGTVFKLTMTPVVDSTNVTSGAAGTTITITGANFTEAYRVFLGARPAQFTINSDSSLTIVIPDNPEVSRIYVFNPFGIGYGAPFTITP